MAKDVRTYLHKGKRYKANDKKAPADVKALIKQREAEFGGVSQAEPISASEIGTKYSNVEDDSLPGDFPGQRALAQAGYTTFTALAELGGDYESVKGIGPETSADIEAYLQDREAQEG